MAGLLDTILARQEKKKALWNSGQSSDQTRNAASASGKVVAFLNQKGGVGKTTLAFNTAHALAAQGQKVLMIDMDPQANLGLYFGIDLEEQSALKEAAEEKNEENDKIKDTQIPGPFSIYHLLVNSVRELKALHVAATLSDVLVKGKGERKVDLLPSSQELSGFELTVSGVNFPRQLILKRFLENHNLTAHYDAIIIDCPPTLGLIVINVLCASHGVIVPFRPDEFSKKGLTHLYGMLQDIEDMGLTEPPRVLTHVPNLVDARRKQEGSDLDDIMELLKQDFAAENVFSPIYNRSQLVRALSQKKSVFDFEAKEYLPLQEQMTELAKTIKDMNYEKNQYL